MQTEIEVLGPWGPVIFVLSVAAGEMVPLLPTQPLAIAGGLLFGAVRVSTSCIISEKILCCTGDTEQIIHTLSAVFPSLKQSWHSIRPPLKVRQLLGLEAWPSHLFFPVL